MALSNDQIIQKLVDKFGDAVTGIEEPYGMLTFEVPKDMNLKVMQFLFDDEELFGDAGLFDGGKVSVIDLITNDDLTDDDDKTVIDYASEVDSSPAKIAPAIPAPTIRVPATPAPITSAPDASNFVVIDNAILDGLLERLDNLEHQTIAHKRLLVQLTFLDKPPKRPRAGSLPISLENSDE